ncbi:MAG TPA: GemA protein [Methylophilaceae bacterium]|nr:GemA protein [Methylophilaceae bacterium]
MQAKDTKKAEIAKIHIAKKDLGLDDETYRSLLWTAARVESSKDLDHAGRAAVLEHFKARGWKPKHVKPNVNNIKQPLIAKIAALLTDMQLSWAYADGIAKQMFKREKVQWCNPQELRGIVAALVIKQSKQNGQPND